MLTCERVSVDRSASEDASLLTYDKGLAVLHGTRSRDRQSRSHPGLLLDQDPIRALDEPPVKGLTSQCGLSVVHVQFQVARVKG